MTLEQLRAWPIANKIAISVIAIVLSVVIFGGIAGVFMQESFTTVYSGEIAEKVDALAQGAVDGKVNEVEIFKTVKEIISETDSTALNNGFYLQIGYNLFGFLGLSLLLGHFFQPKGIKSFQFSNKAPILFVAAFILAINIQQIGGDALKLNELIGLDRLQEFLFGGNKLDDYKNLITQYILLFPNEGRGWVISFIGIALIPAIGEELLFRGYLMRLFSVRSNHHNGIALSALFFALIHFNLTNFFYYFILGVVLGYTYYWGRNLLFPILIHFVNNALVLVIYMEVNSISDEVLDSAQDQVTGPVAIMSYITVALSLAIFYMNFKRNRYLLK